MQAQEFQLLATRSQDRRFDLLFGNRQDAYQGEEDRLQNFKDMAAIQNIMLRYRQEHAVAIGDETLLDTVFDADVAFQLLLKHFVRLIKIIGEKEVVPEAVIQEVVGDIQNYLDLTVGLLWDLNMIMPEEEAMGI